MHLLLLATGVAGGGLYKADSPVATLEAKDVPQKDATDAPLILVVRTNTRRVARMLGQPIRTLQSPPPPYYHVAQEFYSAWCGHCQHFAPTYEQIAREAKKSLPTLRVGAVNCPDHEETCSAHSVSSFPTLKLFPGDHVYKSHDRGVRSVLDWVSKTSGVAAVAHADTPPQPAAAHAGAAATALASAASKAHQQLLETPHIGKPQWRQVVAPAAANASLLSERRQWQPVPAADVYAAARYGLYHEVAAHADADAGKPRDGVAAGSAHLQLRALLEWLLALQRGLPRDADGGVAATAAQELRSLLMRKGGMVSRAEWLQMLEATGVDRWPQEWSACSSANPSLHGYPCSLWLLFHSLASHATHEHALQTMHAIRLYVSTFFGCADCVSHFGNMSARMEEEMGGMPAKHTQRERAVLWLWQAHNRVNARLAAEPDPLDEYLKVEWPLPALCASCHEVAFSQRGTAAQHGHVLRQWRHDQVVRQLHRAYCLEAHFECWTDQQEMSRRPPSQVRSFVGTWGTLVGVVLLLCMACARRAGPAGVEKAADRMV